MEKLEIAPLQERILRIPEPYDLVLPGGRGSMKTFTMLLLVLRFVAQYRDRARALFTRMTYKGLADAENTAREVFGLAYGSAARYNAADHVWRFPEGGYFELGQIENAADYSKFQGRSFGLMLFDEIGQYATSNLVDMMRSNLRGPKGMPLRAVYAANPGGPGHHWIAQRWVYPATPWAPFLDARTGRTLVVAPSTYLDNPFIDQEAYRQQLEAACPADPELLRAWRDGAWDVMRGAYFSGVINESKVAVAPWPKMPMHYGEVWDNWIAHDFGMSAPSVTYLMARSPGAEAFGHFYPRDSVVLVDELAAHRKDNLNAGLGWTAAVTGEAIVEMCKRWGVKARGVADDACFAKTGHSGSIADEFGRKGVTFHPAKKADRISGWQLMSRMLADAGKPDVPGLYVSRNCSYWWATVPFLSRDEKRIEDVDSSGPDHGADACRYGLLRTRRVARVEPLKM